MPARGDEIATFQATFEGPNKYCTASLDAGSSLPEAFGSIPAPSTARQGRLHEER